MAIREKQILISGAGPIGLSFALGLKDSSLSVVVVDQHQRPDHVLLEKDTRMIALSHRSVKFLESVDVWQAIEPFSTPIQSVQVSEKGYATKVEMFASEHNLYDFGALVPLGRLVLEMLNELEKYAQITYLDETRLVNYTLEPEVSAGITRTVAKATLVSKGEKEDVIYDWILAAEGMNSHLRTISGIETYHRDYDQIAVIARARFERPHHNVAYERFTSDGPIALLPVGSHEMAIVMIAKRDEHDRWEKALDEVFANEVIYRVGLDLGDIEAVTDRHIWGLSLMVPKTVCKPCLTLVGNSAHSLHPIAGQGLNLGFRDCELLLPYFKNGAIPTIEDLERYQRERYSDVIKVVGSTDFLVRSFGLDLPGASHLRNIALRTINAIKPLKDRIARFGMGY